MTRAAYEEAVAALAVPSASTGVPDDLPTVLSFAWGPYASDRDPRLRLHRMIDAAETAIRWAALVAIAASCEADGMLPAPIAARVRDHAERPTLGRWVAILRALDRPHAVLGDLFRVYREHLHAWCASDGADEYQSLLTLRNMVAHGGGTDTESARRLIAAHERRMEELLAAIVSATGGARVLGVAHGQMWQLHGTTPRSTSACALPGGVWLDGDGWKLELSPLVTFAPVRRVDDAGELVVVDSSLRVQLYSRMATTLVEYGVYGPGPSRSFDSAMAGVRRVFRFDEPRRVNKKTPASDWRDFLEEARTRADDLVGRVSEVTTCKAWVRGDGAAIGWIAGRPGIGKTMLLDRVATDAANAPPAQRCVVYHRFVAADHRNHRTALLQRLRQALAEWPSLRAITGDAEDDVEGDELVADVLARLGRIAELPASPRGGAPRLVVIIDGLDEVMTHDPDVPELIASLAQPRTRWLVAGRDARALARCGGAAVFPAGMPAMTAEDVRAMLMERLGPERYALLARDRSTADGIRNPFVEGVLAAADGLPLYVHWVIMDLEAGRLSVNDERALPQGLTAYYERVLARTGLSDVQRDLPSVIALLARAAEPLDDDMLAGLLAGERAVDDVWRGRARAALRAAGSILRPAATVDGSEGHQLYHESFREHLVASSAMRGTLAEAAAQLIGLSARCRTIASVALRRHLLRHGLRYALDLGSDADREAALARLVSFTDLFDRLDGLPAGDVGRLLGDFEHAIRGAPNDITRARLRIWHRAIRLAAHMLRRGDESWSSGRILVQVASEYAAETPVRRAVDAWLESGACDWLWLRRRSGDPRREAAVFAGHVGPVRAAVVIDHDRIASLGEDGTVRVWDVPTVSEIERHDGQDALAMWGSYARSPAEPPSGWTLDGVEQDLLDGSRLRVSWQGPTQHWGIFDAPTQSERSVSLRLDVVGADGVTLAHLERTLDCTGFQHGKLVGIFELGDGRLLVRRISDALVWDPATGSCVTCAGPRIVADTSSEYAWATLAQEVATIRGHLVLPGSRLVLFGASSQIEVIDTTTGGMLYELHGHTGSVIGARLLAGERLLTWSDDRTIRCWDLRAAGSIGVWRHHEGSVLGVIELDGEHYVSWSSDGTLRHFRIDRRRSANQLEDDLPRQDEVVPLLDGRRCLSTCTRSERFELQPTAVLWDVQRGVPIVALTVSGDISVGSDAFYIDGSGFDLTTGEPVDRRHRPDPRRRPMKALPRLTAVDGYAVRSIAHGCELAGAGVLARWFTDAPVRVCGVFRDGTIVLAPEAGALIFLELRSGVAAVGLPGSSPR